MPLRKTKYNDSLDLALHEASQEFCNVDVILITPDQLSESITDILREVFDLLRANDNWCLCKLGYWNSASPWYIAMLEAVFESALGSNDLNAMNEFTCYGDSMLLLGICDYCWNAGITLILQLPAAQMSIILWEGDLLKLVCGMQNVTGSEVIYQKQINDLFSRNKSSSGS